MIIDITELTTAASKEVEVKQEINIDKEVYKNTDIIRLDNVEVSGNISVDDASFYHIDLDVFGTMVLPCSITLKEVSYKFSCRIDEIYSEDEISNFKNDKKMKNSIDILPIIWENIILEIPLRVVSDDAYDTKLEGDGWRLITDNQEGEE